MLTGFRSCGSLLSKLKWVKHPSILFTRRTITNGGPENSDSGFKFPIWKSFAFSALCGVGVMGYVRYIESKRKVKVEVPTSVIGEARIGGHITGLVTEDGNPFDSSLLEKTFMLVYFGFTHCPDVCPEELDRMCMIKKLVDDSNNPDKATLLPIFITIDATRDTPAVLKNYLNDFTPRVTGLTGSEDDVSRVARLYRVYFRPARTTGLDSVSSDQKVKDGDYLMDHSTFVFLVDPHGRYVTHFGRESKPERSASLILDAMESYAANS